MRAAPLLAGLCAVLGCAHGAPTPNAETLDGLWHAALTSPGGPLPFTLQIAGAQASIHNGEERAPISSVTRTEGGVVLDFATYDARIRAAWSEDGATLRGTWTKQGSTRVYTLPFEARRGARPRFDAGPARGGVTGIWRVEFEDDGGREPARGLFTQAEDGTVTGTFLTPTGDYRYLAGALDGDVLRLSCFDGAHAFLFHARLEGETLTGDFWSSDKYHATWTATRVERAEQAPLPDPYGLATLTSPDRRMRFAFEDTEGRVVSADDARFAGKVVLVDIFGTWCPNCNDQAPYLAEWHDRYRDRGFEVVGLAYEVSGDVERDREMLRRYRDRYGLRFPLLLGGVNDKARAGETLPDLSAVVAYPTTIFIGRDGTVRAVHSGFAGPGTGAAHTALISEMEARIEALLAEPPP